MNMMLLKRNRICSVKELDGPIFYRQEVDTYDYEYQAYIQGLPHNKDQYEIVILQSLFQYMHIIGYYIMHLLTISPR